MPGPLSGLRVLELARVLAGPWAGQLLADLGADVIKVERAGVGDDTRGWGPPFVAAADGGNLGAAYYHATNRGKRSIEVDFDTGKGQQTVRRLAKRSDVLIENFKVGNLAKFGLDYKHLSAINPGLIYCSVTGFGQDGSYASRAGYDLLVQGMGGIMSVTGLQHGEPMRVGVAYADIFTGVYSAIGIMAALAEREKTGSGSHVDVALLDVQVGVLANQALSYLVTGKPPGRTGNANPAVVPYQVFPASDGQIIIAAGNDGQFAKLCDVLGDDKLARDPRFRSNADRVRNRADLVQRISALTSRRSRLDLMTLLESVQVPSGPINDLAEVFADPQVIHRKMRIELPSASAERGVIPGVRTPISLNAIPMAANRPSPRLGEHTQEILRELAREDEAPL